MCTLSHMCYTLTHTHNTHTHTHTHNIAHSPRFESFQLAQGSPQTVPTYNPTLVYQGTHVLNSNRVRAWKEGATCVWQQHGVWDYEDAGGGEGGVDKVAKLLKKDYFQWRTESGAGDGEGGSKKVKVDSTKDYFIPFALRFKKAINEGRTSRKSARDRMHYVQ